MPSIICHLPNGNFLEWSTVSDAPTTYGVPRAQFDEYARQRYGNYYFDNDHAQRMDLAIKHGTSARAPRLMSLEELIENNRAGPDENCLTLEELVAEFGELPEDYEWGDPDDQHAPDGYQVIDSTTGETVDYAAHEILTWKLARKVKSRHRSDLYLIVAATFAEIGAELEEGLKPRLVDETTA